MARLDDRLREDLERAARPADPSGLYENLIRRRERRRVRRQFRTGGLALAVLAGCVVGILALSRVFGDPAPQRPGEGGIPVAANGAIVVERVSDGEGGGQHLWLVEPDGSEDRRLTFGRVIDSWVSWSPDGTRIAFQRDDLDHPRASGLAFLDIASGEITLSEEPSFGAVRPSWSPDGSRIAFAGGRGGIYVMDVDGSNLERITDARFVAPDNPEWSADGSTIAFSGNLDETPTSWDIYLVDPDGGNLHDVTNTPDEAESESVIGWLPNGNLLARVGPSEITIGPGQPVQIERWVEMTTRGEVIRVVFEGAANTEETRQSPSVSPDGRYVVFDTPDGSGNNMRVMEIATGTVTAITNGAGPAWQPLPAVASIEPTPTGTPTPVPSEGTDAGLGFVLCDVHRVGQGPFVEDGGSVYIGAKSVDGRCPGGQEMADSVVLLDLSGDQRFEAAVAEVRCAAPCTAFSTPDVDGDGTKELLIQNVEFSVAGLQLIDFGTRAGPDGEESGAFAVVVASPADPEHGFEPDVPPQLWIGGDAFELDALTCEARPSGRVLIVSTATQEPPDSPDGVWKVHETVLRLASTGVLEMVSSRDYEDPLEGGPSFVGDGTLCGAWLPYPFSGD